MRPSLHATPGHGCIARRLLIAAASIVGSMVLVPGAAGQQPSCADNAPELDAVIFTGNKALSSNGLSKVIAMKPSSWLRRTVSFLGTRRCVNRTDVPPDVVRLLLHYRRRGYARATVGANFIPHDQHATVHFEIDEAQPLTLDSVVVRSSGSDALRSSLARAVTLRTGNPLDQDSLVAARTATQRWLRNRGYLSPEVTVSAIVDSAAYHAFALVQVKPGPLVRLGELHVTSRPFAGEQPRVAITEVRGLLALHSGSVLSEPALEQAQQRLASTDVYDRVAIRVDSSRRDLRDTTSDPPSSGTARGTTPPTARTTEDTVAIANVHVDLTEAPANTLQLRTGYGTLDCFRVQTELQRTAFLRPAGHLDISARLSKIAIGAPLDFAPSLCSGAAQADPYSQRLNYYLGATYRYPALGRTSLERSLTLYTERRSEYLAYLRTTFIGAIASISRALWGRWRGTLGYALSYGKTDAPPAVLCVNFNACLPVDREQLTNARPLGVLSGVLSHDRVDDPVNPTRGHTLRFEVRGSATWLGSNPDERFLGGLIDGTIYRSLNTRTVLATGLRLGVVGSPGDALVPQQERLFAGGSTTIRGYEQNEVGPRTYIADSVQTVVQGSDTLLTSDPRVGHSQAVPTGGNTMIVANAELRMRPPRIGTYVQLATFVDAGSVWIRGSHEPNAAFKFRITPGVGVRALTPIGPVRVDVAYNGYAPRPGPVYRDTPLGLQSAPLYCVSPGNTLKVTGTGQTDANGNPVPPTQEEGECPSTFVPSQASSFLDRLTLHLSIGQAF